LYSTPDILRAIKTRGTRRGEHGGENYVGLQHFLSALQKERRPHEKPRRRRNDNIKPDFKHMFLSVDWIQVDQNRDQEWILVKTLNISVPLKSGDLLSK
jgi:hypothetical protein